MDNSIINLAKEHQSLKNMEKLLKNKQKFRMNKLQQLRKISNSNPYLNHVISDYKSNLNNENEIKQKQINALKELSEYISHVTNNSNISKKMAENSKIHQNEILTHIKHLQSQ